MELLHKLATEVKLDFIEAVDQRYTHTSSIITTQQGTDIVVPNVELLGRAKITGPSRYTSQPNTPNKTEENTNQNQENTEQNTPATPENPTIPEAQPQPEVLRHNKVYMYTQHRQNQTQFHRPK